MNFKTIWIIGAAVGLATYLLLWLTLGNLGI